VKPSHAVSICAIAGIVIIESVALLTRTDGRFLGIALVAVSGLGGFFLGRTVRPS